MNSVTIGSDLIIADKIVFDKAAYEQFKLYTRLYGKSEWGGVCIGHQDNKLFHVKAVVLPPQSVQSGVYCEFRKELFPLVTKNLFAVQDNHEGFNHYRPGAWIHTHPGFGVFFSGTDDESFKYLTKMSPDYLAIVVDPIGNKYIGFNGIIEKKTVKVPSVKEGESESEGIELKEQEIESFTQIEVEISNTQLDDSDELAFLQSFKNMVESEASAKILGEAETIRTFIPMKQNELKTEILQVKVQFLEDQVSAMYRPSSYYIEQSRAFQVLVDFVSKVPSLSSAAIPTMMKITDRGIFYAWYSEVGTISTTLVPQDSIRNVELGTYYNQQMTQQGYPFTVSVKELMFDVKGGIFSMKTDKRRLLLYLTDGPDLDVCLLEIFPGSKFVDYTVSPVSEDESEEKDEVSVDDDEEELEDVEDIGIDDDREDQSADDEANGNDLDSEG